MSPMTTTSTRRAALVVMVVLALAVVRLPSSSAEAPPGPTADVVFGQGGNFTTGTANNGGRSATSLSGPDGAVADDQGNLYITDTGNHRVLFYPAGSTTATRVYGQGGDFTTGTSNNGGISANSLSFPRGLALDSGGNLYVGDTGNNRVLFYPAGSTTATRVYGQAGSFATNTANNGGLSANSLFGPDDVAVDGNNNLYVVDLLNNRVLFYLNGNTTAKTVYGQSNFISSGASVSATGLNGPSGLAVDTGNNLYVVDANNNRALFYPASSTTATAVYGQPNFTTATANTGGLTASSLSTPRRIAAAPNNDIYIMDNANNRALKYVAHDLALLKITAPASLGVDPGVPVTKPVTVQIQNRGSGPEVLPNAGVLGDGTTTGLVRLTVSVVDNDSENCQAATVVLNAAKNAALFNNGPRTIKSKTNLTIHYLVTYECNNPALKVASDTTPGDYSHTATVFRSVLGDADSHPEDDNCPHNPLDTPSHRDPNPDGSIVDKGCGTKKPDGTFANPVTNIFLK